MSRYTPTALGRNLVRFFEDYLPVQRGLSPHTIRSYRDALLLLLRFTASERHCTVDRLDVQDLSVERITRFLATLEAERHNCIATRNARLGAIHVFARYLAGQCPEQLGTLQRIIGLPFKRGAIAASVEYLDRTELDALLKSIDRSTELGRRDYALFAFMFNTGARVQETLNVRVADVRLEAPPQVRLLGKGRKTRTCPLWPATACLLRDLIAERGGFVDQSDSPPIFMNARGSPLTRYGVRYLLCRYVQKASQIAPSLKSKKLHPHSIRHSTAVALLKSGVDFVTISHWLGHAGLNTTMRYARADIDLKRQALAQVFPDAVTPPPGGRLRLNGSDLISWLRKL
ncbi:tyrosine-type recombinase/integrase [Aeromonas veronii]|uniref:tyrosine-type recombinase/integrase n=1 Tax=Aeromonas veronii TaxID=654 RepID=UPI001116B141|nr:tyrosine-type recombinase/integrase [Aeromonas veronii]TNH99976.1 integrase [Aeromonas veronii]HDO1314190.1 site-specific integrase [Aeromonas veronii]HDO1354883.1 site-specific integrase [Aeromonas veronii]